MNEKTKNLQNLLKLVKELSSRDDMEWFKNDLKNHFNLESNQLKNSPLNNDLSQLTKDLRRTGYFLRNIDKTIWSEGQIFYLKIFDFDLKINLLKNFKIMRIAEYENNFLEYTRGLFLQLEICINYSCTALNVHEIITDNPSKFIDGYHNLVEGKYSFFDNGKPKDIKKISISSRVFFVKTFYSINYSFKDFQDMTTLRNLSSHGDGSEKDITGILGDKYVVVEKKADYLRCYLSFYNKMECLFY
jgi:hypothetical protein